MPNKRVLLMPDSIDRLENMGEQIKLARLRRDISIDLVSKRAGVSTNTVWSIEKGSPSVSMGAYVAVLHALGGMDKDILLIAKDDAFGRMLQDLELKTNKRASKRKKYI